MRRSPGNLAADALMRAIVERAAELVREQSATRGPSEPSTRSPYVTASEAADLLRTSPRRVYRLVGDGRLDGVKDGFRLLVVRASIDRHPQALGEGEV